MKRRDFLIKSVGLAGVSTIAPRLAGGQVPCPPPTTSVSGGTSVTTPCGVGDAPADWLARSTAPGVVWAHNFESASEVNQFRWVGGFGNDPNSQTQHSSQCRHVTTDGFAGGGCLEIALPTGVGLGGNIPSWWRPFSAIFAGDNGKTTNDPGANGTIPAKAWNASNASQNGQWTGGYYGHSDYHTGGIWDGTDFYIQFRVKISASRYASGNPDGKLAFIGTTGLTPAQELLITSRQHRVFYVYTGFGSPGPYELWGDPQNNPVRWQPGGAYHSTCTGPGPTSTPIGGCWAFTPDQWTTFLVHVIPGHGDFGAYNTANTDTGFQVWAARAGETSYTKIYDKLNYVIGFHSGKPKGWNAFQPSGYMNGAQAAQAWSQRYTQIIFSNQFVPCPQA